MNIRKKIAIAYMIFSGAFYAAHSFAQANEDTQKLSSMLNAVKTMQANFKQTVFDNRDKVIQTSYGKMAMQRPGKFRWDVTKPIPQLIIANDSRIWIYDADLQQVTIRPMSKATSDTPALLLSDVDSVLTKDYTVKPSKVVNSTTWFSLKPRNPDNMFEKIELGFEKDQITEMRLADHLGHTTSVKFQQVQTNKPLSADLFTFKAKSNVDVVDETK
jgi:outer membrane lipoprotein carrier protein